MPAFPSARAAVAALIAAAALAVGVARRRALPAVAREHVLTLKGVDAPGPARLDRVKVLQMGPASARHVLVLDPGTSAGAPYFRPIAHDLLARLRGWQIWSIERRENGLEDHSVLRRALERKVSVQRLFDYYLGWIGKSGPGRHFEPVADSGRELRQALGHGRRDGDLHRVIAAAKRDGRTVVLGGHSLGGSMTTAYATWDFGGRAGASDLAGLVFIDGAGGAIGRQLPTARRGPQVARRPRSGGRLAVLEPRLRALGGRRLQRRRLDAPPGWRRQALSVFDAWPLLPGILRPPVPTTEPRRLRLRHRHRHLPGQPARWSRSTSATSRSPAIRATGLTASSAPSTGRATVLVASRRSTAPPVPPARGSRSTRCWRSTTACATRLRRSSATALPWPRRAPADVLDRDLARAPAAF